jgi:hypothetical protein
MNQKSNSPVAQLRRELHQLVADSEPIDVRDIERVNTFSRIERIKQEARLLTAALVDPAPEIHNELDIFEHLAVDWVYSGELDWETSMAAKQAARIVAMNNADASEDAEPCNV